MLFIQLFLTNRPAGYTLPATVYGIFFSLCAGSIQTAISRFTAADPDHAKRTLLSGFSLSFSLKLTRIMSLPIWHTSQNGITYSFSLPKNPQIHPGPGTTSAVIQPVFSSNSRSPTYPRRAQSFILMTSFCFRS